MIGSDLLKTEFGKLGYDFAKALQCGNYASAYSMLSYMQKASWTPQSLGQCYEEMISYGDGGADHVEAMEGYAEYPKKKKDDIGGVYVAICGPGYSEAVTVFVKMENGTPKIREIGWGRP